MDRCNRVGGDRRCAETAPAAAAIKHLADRRRRSDRARRFDLRVYDLGHLPPTLSGDEGSQGVEALRILHKKLAFIVLPQRRSELDFIKQTYPNGRGYAVPSPAPAPDSTSPLFFVYEVTVKP